MITIFIYFGISIVLYFTLYTVKNKTIILNGKKPAAVVARTLPLKNMVGTLLVLQIWLKFYSYKPHFIF